MLEAFFLSLSVYVSKIIFSSQTIACITIFNRIIKYRAMDHHALYAACVITVSHSHKDEYHTEALQFHLDKISSCF